MPMHRVEVVWTGSGGMPGVSTFYIDSLVHPTPQAASDSVGANLSAFGPKVADSFVGVTDSTVTTYVTPNEIMTVTGVTPFTIATSATGDFMPRAAQGLLQLRTGIYVGNREVRGKVFLPGITSTSNDGATGGPNAAYITFGNTLGLAMIADGIHVASRTHNLFYEVATATTWNKWAVLRSRRD